MVFGQQLTKIKENDMTKYWLNLKDILVKWKNNNYN